MIQAAREQKLIWLAVVLYNIRNGNQININKPDPHEDFNTTALHQAAQLGKGDILQLLIERWADIEAKDNMGMNPLYAAIDSGYIPIVKLLLDQGANVNAQNKDGETALHIAARRGYEPIVKLLLSKNANAAVTNIDGNTPLISLQRKLKKVSGASKERYQAIIKLLENPKKRSWIWNR